VKHAVGAVEDFEPGRIKLVEIGGRSIGVVNAGDTFYAVLNVCPHELAPVCEGTLSGTMLPSLPGDAEYGLEGRILRCPWHGYEYDLANHGRAAFTAFRGRVRLFDVSVEDGRVLVEVPDRRR
jgi:3-phenylpropionate/trans-cinnamate dioxygenase ferredoxin subunit